MFEDSKVHDGRELSDVTQTLLTRHRSRKAYYGILKNRSIPENTKLEIRKSPSKQRLMRAIEQDMCDPVRPDGTYEIWNKETFTVGRSSGTTGPSVAKYDAEGISQLLQQTHNTTSDDAVQNERLVRKQSIEAFQKKIQDTVKMKSGTQYLTQIKGYEMLPERKRGLFHQYHLDNLTFLLHRNITSGNWDLAYKIFTIVIRIKGSDLRSLWPLGVEILRGKYKAEGEPGFRTKEHQFLSWLVSYYIIGPTKVSNRNHDPVYRYGTEDHVPLYVVELYWSLFEDQKFEQVKTGLTSLIIKEPYSKSGVLSFMLSLTYLFENIQLASSYAEIQNDGDEDIDGNRGPMILKDMEHNFHELEKNLKACEAANFVYSRSFIDEQVEKIRDKVKEADELADYDRYKPSSSTQMVDDIESDSESEDEVANLISKNLGTNDNNDASSVVDFSDFSDSEPKTVINKDDTGWLSSEELESSQPAAASNEGPDASDEEEIPDPYDEEEIPDPYDEEEIPDPYDEEEIPDPYDEEEIPDPYDEEEIPDPYDEEEIPDPYDEEEIPDPYDEEEIPDPYDEEGIYDPELIHAVASSSPNRIEELSDVPAEDNNKEDDQDEDEIPDQYSDSETFYDAHDIQDKGEVNASPARIEDSFEFDYDNDIHETTTTIKKNDREDQMDFDFEFF